MKRVSKAKFDRNAYQREYMRKKRAAAKAKNPKKQTKAGKK